jgi:hypothetical protein
MSTKNHPARLRIVYSAAAAVMLVMVVAVIVVSCVRSADERRERNAEIRRDCEYAGFFNMSTIANPEVNERFRYNGYLANPEDYTRVVFCEEYPLEADRETAVIYAAPVPNRTNHHITTLNMVIAMRPDLLSGTGLSSQLTQDDVLFRHEAVRAVIDRLESYEFVYFIYGDDRSDEAPEDWYAAITQAAAERDAARMSH